jgi:hypothetical protein
MYKRIEIIQSFPPFLCTTRRPHTVMDILSKATFQAFDRNTSGALLLLLLLLLLPVVAHSSL